MLSAALVLALGACKGGDGGGDDGDDVVIFDWGNTGSLAINMTNGDAYKGSSLPLSGATGPATSGSLGGKYTKATIWVKLFNAEDGATPNTATTESLAMAIFSTKADWNGSNDVICNLTSFSGTDLDQDPPPAGNVWDSSAGYKPFGMTAKVTHVAIQAKVTENGDGSPLSAVRSAKVYRIKFER